MTKTLNISLAQLNFTVGDLAGNQKKIIEAHKKAHAQKADLLVFPELAITGYPPEDLILRPEFQKKAIEMVRKLAILTKNGTAILIGSPWLEGDHLYNAAVLLDGGELQHVACKSNLPNYGVFDEKRVFSAAPLPHIVEFRDIKLGILICEEIWDLKVSTHLKKEGAELFISIHASPFEHQKHLARIKVAGRIAETSGVPLIYLNLIGGQDELVFDGNSFVMSASGEVIYTMPHFREDISSTKWKKTPSGWRTEPGEITISHSKYDAIYEALQTGLIDYVRKNGFKTVIIGMSGGIDSAITAVIATDTLGAENVRLVMMPSRFTSEESILDAKDCAYFLGIELETIPIVDLVDEYTNLLEPAFRGLRPDITEENLQSRIRGNILMALSNKFGHLVLTTGNKSEMAVGYATLYGDMCGGYNLLKDIYKTEVFELCKWRNLQSLVIPDNIITKAPSAELRENQKDQDSLPPYEILDSILHRLIEMQQSENDIVHSGFEPETVKKVVRLLKLSEYKRRQAAPGVKISKLAFGRDRRYPITNAYDF